MCSYALEVINLNKSYKNFNIKDLSISIPIGSIMGFIGPNGAGKTTTIKSILNMVRYESGEIRFFGEPYNFENIGVVTDVDELYEGEWKVNDIRKVMRLYYKQWDNARFDKLIQEWNIDSNKKVEELSRGMGVKLMIAVALSHDAKLLILDEPTSGLDPIARDEVCDLLLEYVANGDKTVFFSTHITMDIEKIADKVIFIYNGRIIFSEDMESIIKKYALVEGNADLLNDKHRKMIKGLVIRKDRYNGMVDVKDSLDLPIDTTFPASLDDIIVRMNKEGKNV